MGNEDEKLEKIDCASLSAKQIGNKLSSLDDGAEVLLTGCAPSLSGLGAGSRLSAAVRVDGGAGNFACMLSSDTDWELRGDAGCGMGHSLVSGRVLATGTAMDHTGAYAQGGFIAVLGRSGQYSGFALDGGEVLIRSICGDYAGARMKAGVLVLANGTGNQLGKGMTGGDIFLRGDAESVSDCIKKHRMKDADSLRLSLLLARAGIQGDVKEFSLYRSRKG